MTALQRNNVVEHGRRDGRPMVFAHGFGCDQNMWRFVWPEFADDHRIVLFDHVGAGGSDASAFDRDRYASLQGYADDVLEICRELDLTDVVFVGHSVSAMIGVLAATAEPERFGRLVLVGPSPRYIDDEDYAGGFTREDIEGLLESMDSNYLGWSGAMAPVIMGNEDRPELGEELTNSFCRADPEIARHFARVTFLSDNRADLPRVRTPSLVLQCAQDVIAPDAVGEYVDRQLPDSRLVRLDGDGPLPEPQRSRGDGRGDRGVPGRVTSADELPEDTAEDLFENAPCGYLSTLPDGTIVRVNRTFEAWTGLRREELVGARRFQDLLSPGGRIYHETHYAPLLRMQGSVREIAVEIVRADGTRLPALINSVLHSDERGPPAARPDDGVRRDGPAPLRGRAAARAPPGAGDRPAAQPQPAVGQPAGRAGAGGRGRLPPGRQRPRGRRRLVRRVLARRGRDGRPGHRGRRRPRDRRGGDDGPAAQRGARARLDGPRAGAPARRARRLRGAPRRSAG